MTAQYEYHRRYIFKKKYGITVDEYEVMLEKQGGLCALCGEPEKIAGQRLAVDHDHETGKVRGLLCKNCNVGIGSLGDSIEKLRAAIAYLERSA